MTLTYGNIDRLHGQPGMYVCGQSVIMLNDTDLF